MNLSTLLKVLEYIDENPTNVVDFGLHGEALLHPQAVEFISVAKHYKKTRSLYIHTNGTMLTEEMCRKLMDIGINVEVSIHTEKSLLGYKRMVDANTQGTYRVQGSCLSACAPKLKKWMENVGITEHHLNSPSGKLLVLTGMHNWALDAPRENNYKDKCHFIQGGRCVVKWDGKIYACCFDFSGTNHIGHIDNFPALVHKPETYKLCDSCSPAWVNWNKALETWSVSDYYANFGDS